MNTIDIFRSGRHTAMSGVTLDFSEADLDAMAAAYSPARHEAPIVVGHPQDNAPAYGWVASLARAGDTLTATPAQVDPAFAELVTAGRYKKVSASFYAPDSPANPSPGVYYLRHVGFLGAQPPAVKGLRDAQFAEDEPGIVTLDFTEPEPQPREEPMNIKTDPTPAPTDPAFAEREAALAARQAELDAREAALVAHETAARRRAHADFAERLIKEGRLLPKDKGGLVEFMAALSEDTTLEFGEGADAFKGAPRAWFERFLAELPVQVDFSEHTPPAGQPPSVRFNAPRDVQPDAERLALHQQALAYQEAHPGVSYSDAVLTVSQGA